MTPDIDDFVYELQMENMGMKDRIAELEHEVKRLSDRDCRAKIQLSYNDGTNPFEVEYLRTVDVGVADNVYVVESKVLNESLKRIEELEKENAALQSQIAELIGVQK